MVGGPGNDTFEDFTKGEDTIAFAFSNAETNAADLENLLRNSTGNVLDLSLLGPGFEDFGERSGGASRSAPGPAPAPPGVGNPLAVVSTSPRSGRYHARHHGFDLACRVVRAR